MKKIRSYKKSPRLQFERLENRLAMAGNVTTAITGSGVNAVLNITGNDFENDISITPVVDLGGVTTHLRIAGNVDSSGRATTINFGVLADIPVGTFASLNIDLKKAETPHGAERGRRGLAGFDAVLIDGTVANPIVLTGKLAIKGTHAGNIDISNVNVAKDTSITFGTGIRQSLRGFIGVQQVGSFVQISNSELGVPIGSGVAGKLDITTGNTEDSIDLLNVTVGSSVIVKTNGDDDSVGFGNVRALSNSTGKLDIQSGAGSDFVELFDSFACTEILVKTEAGFDSVSISNSQAQLRKIDVSTGADGDSVTVSDSIAGIDILVKTEAGFDDVEVSNSLSRLGKIDVNTGTDSDFVSIVLRTTGPTTGTDLIVDTGADDDRVEIQGNVSASASIGRDLTVKTQAGDDAIGIFDVNVGRATSLTGGTESDAVDIQGGIFGLLDIVNTKLSIDLGNGEDDVRILGIDVRILTEIKGGGGADEVHLGDLLGASVNTFAKNAKIDLGGSGVGDGQTVEILGVLTSLGVANAASTASVTFTGDLEIFGSPREDCVGLKGVKVGGNFTVNTFADHDFIGATDLIVVGNLKVNAGDGDDIIAIGVIPSTVGSPQSFVGGTTNVTAGAGADLVVAQLTQFVGAVTVTLGGNGNRVVIDECDFDAAVTVTGNATDRLAEDDNTFAVTPSVNFEGEIDPGLLPGIIDEIFEHVEECFPGVLPVVI